MLLWAFKFWFTLASAAKLPQNDARGLHTVTIRVIESSLTLQNESIGNLYPKIARDKNPEIKKNPESRR